MHSQNMTEKIFLNMSVDEKIGQLCVPILQSGEITNDLVRFVKEYHVGMLRYCPNAEFDNSSEVVGKPNIYFTPDETADFIKSIQRMAKIPLFFAVDQEGGSRNDVNRGGAFAYGGHMQFGAADDVELTYEVARATGKEFASMGINLVQAPIVDVLSYDGRKTMKAATFGDEVTRVCRHSLAMMRGFHDGGIAVMAKHFPGYGSVATDAHKGIAEILKDFDSLNSEDIAPMKLLFENGLNGVMTGHVVTHCIDDEYPATVSKKVITEYLRNTLHFDGIVETDAMRMPAMQKLYGTGKAAVMAINAGCDLVLLRGDMQHFIDGFNAIKDAVEDGSITIDRINESVRRILKQKSRCGILDNSPHEETTKTVGCKKHQILAQQLADKSISMIKNDGVKLADDADILVICSEVQKIRAAEDSIQCVDMLEKAIKGKFNKTDGLLVGLNPDEHDIRKVQEALDTKKYDAVIYGCCNAIIYNGQTALAQQIRKRSQYMITVALESPYDIEVMPNSEKFICTYGVSAQSMKAVAGLLTGELTHSALPPVRLNL